MRTHCVFIATLIICSLSCVSSQDLVDETVNGNLNSVKKIILSGSDVNAFVKDIDGVKKSPLMVAVAHGKTDIAKLLIESGANINYSKRWMNALHLALIRKKYDTAIMLVEMGADVNARFPNTTPLVVAIVAHQSVLAKKMIENNADVNATATDLAWAPILFAIQENQRAIFDLMLEKGADINAEGGTESFRCITALEVARNNGNRVFFNILKSRGAKNQCQR
jgi:ankyrin repeat protein